LGQTLSGEPFYQPGTPITTLQSLSLTSANTHTFATGISFSTPIQKLKPIFCDYCGKKIGGNSTARNSIVGSKETRHVCDDCKIKVYDKLLGKENVPLNRL